MSAPSQGRGRAVVSIPSHTIIIDPEPPDNNNQSQAHAQEEIEAVSESNRPGPLSMILFPTLFLVPAVRLPLTPASLGVRMPLFPSLSPSLTNIVKAQPGTGPLVPSISHKLHLL